MLNGLDGFWNSDSVILMKSYSVLMFKWNNFIQRSLVAFLTFLFINCEIVDIILN